MSAALQLKEEPRRGPAEIDFRTTGDGAALLIRITDPTEANPKANSAIGLSPADVEKLRQWLNAWKPEA